MLVWFTPLKLRKPPVRTTPIPLFIDTVLDVVKLVGFTVRVPELLLETAREPVPPTTV